MVGNDGATRPDKDVVVVATTVVVVVVVVADPAPSPAAKVVADASTVVHAPPSTKRARKRGRIPRSG
jgi:hypothetical protein